MDNIYNYYKTNKLLCKNTNNTHDFFTVTTKKSILEKVKTSINKLKNDVDKNYNANSDDTLKKIDILFNDYIINESKRNIDKFFLNLNLIKSSLAGKQNIKSDIKKMIRFNTNNEQEIIQNPFYETNYIKNHLISRSNNFINNKTESNIQLDIISQGRYINLSYPTLGIINSKLTNFNKTNKKNNFCDLTSFFNHISYSIHNEFEDNNYYFKLPLQFINIGQTISNILTNNISNKNISSVINFINTNDVNIFNTMTYEKIVKNKRQRLFKTKYMIPYQFSDKTGRIELIKNVKLKKFEKNYIQYLGIEKELYINVYRVLQENKANKSILNDCYKIMFLFSHRNIILFYDIYSNFINGKINKYILSLKLSNNAVYKDLNYKKYFTYINKLNASLLSVKTILLNKLYYIFKPNIIGKNYGVSYIQNNNLISTTYVRNDIIFTGNNIYEKIFFDENLNGKDSNSDLFTNFLENDYYDKNLKLFIGASYNDNKNIDSALGILDIDSNKSKINKNFNIKIIKYIMNIFKNCIPIELLDNLTQKRNYFKTTLNNRDKQNIKNYIINSFKENLDKSTKYLLEMKTSDKKKHKLLILKSKIFYNISYFNYKVVETSMYDIALKNEIRNQINIIKDKYLKIIKKKFK